MPAPAILSGQMEPPPVKPVVEMDFANSVYKVSDEEIASVESLLYNASGPFSDLIIIAGRGITGLHWDTTLWDWDTNSGIAPPSVRGTTTMNEILAATMAQSGGLTAVCEFDVSSPEIWGANDQCPIFWLQRDSIWGDGAVDGDVYWQCYIESGVQGEGYFNDYINPANTSYAGGSAWEASNDRRYRMSGTWGFDRGPNVGVLRYDNGQSIDGQPQGIDTSFGQTPNKANKGLHYMDKVTASHFFGVGMDFADIAARGVDDGWAWWPKGGWDIRYLAFYRARPVRVLSMLAKPPHTPIRVGQLYAEVIHSRPVIPGFFRHVPATVNVRPVLPKVGIVAHPVLNMSVTARAPTTIGN